MRHVPIAGSFGVPRHSPGPSGMAPVQTASEPSPCARSTTRAATARPSSSPARTSLGYCTPATTRERPASSARAAKSAARSGYRWASTAAAAPAATACSAGYDGLGGVGSAVTSAGSAVAGRGRLSAYLAAQAATVASWMATLTRARVRYPRTATGARMDRAVASSFQR